MRNTPPANKTTFAILSLYTTYYQGNQEMWMKRDDGFRTDQHAVDIGSDRHHLRQHSSFLPLELAWVGYRHPDCRRPSVVNGIDKASVTSIYCSGHKPFYELGSWVGGRSPGPSIIHDAPRTSGRREKVKFNNTIGRGVAINRFIFEFSLV